MVKVFIDLIPFSLCMALIVYIWYQHFLFFIRFCFRNKKIVVLNAILLFLILFYVYLLKFLAKILLSLYLSPIFRLFEVQSNWGVKLSDMISSVDQMSSTMMIYGLFGSAIFFLMAAMYKYALNKKHELKLNEIELYDTKTSFISLLIMGSIPFLSVILSIIFRNSVLGGILGGFIYWLYIPSFIISSRKAAKKGKYLSLIRKKERLLNISFYKILLGHIFYQFNFKDLMIKTNY